MEDNALDFSIQLLNNLKEGKSCESIIKQLEFISIADLDASIPDDSSKKAFWINIFNGFCMISLAQNPDIITTESGRIKHLNTKKIIIAGTSLSLYNILHGLIRSSKAIWGKGYFRKFWVNSFEKVFRIQETDPRIHFAVNYGSNSFPCIYIYSNDYIDDQLENSTREFLRSTSIFLPEKNLISVPPVFIWYLGDFGGIKGILRFLKQYNIVPKDEYPHFYFTDMDWTPCLNKFA